MLPILLLTLACAPQGAPPPEDPETLASLAERYPWSNPGDGIPELDMSAAEELPGGVKKLTTQAGEGRSPEAGSMVAVHYNGWIAETGVLIESTAQKGRPVQFMIGHGRVMGFWEVSLPTMKEGERARLEVPADMAWRKHGSFDGKVPPHTDVVYDVWLISSSEG